MGNFKEYAKLYDVIYADKDYKAEADYVIAFIKKHHPKATTILNLGCGTGKHDTHFTKAGYRVTGVDMSENMVGIAQKNAKKNGINADFVCGDIRTVRLKKKFDVVVSLFHVMSYQTTNADVLNALETAKTHLAKNGLLIFDFWHGPGVLTDLPAVRSRKFKTKDLSLTRVSVPTLHTAENVVDVKFELYYKTGKNKQYSYLEELHRMRYFFEPELQLMLEQKGLLITGRYEWMTEKAPAANSWNALLICQ
ncbi:MAG TPA: methyltransferase domain-containing protein [Chitinophagales bacterium]|nr:methyltransferase domain-containing protein [Chitinophagales bacterium]